MGERAHTKGPWFICGEPGHEPQSDSWREGVTIGSDPEGTRICDLTSLRVDWQNAANARLIAAAPDMFEALHACHKFLSKQAPNNDAMLDLIDAVLAKAAPTPSDRREGL